MHGRARTSLAAALIALGLLATSGIVSATPPASVSDGTGPLDTQADLEAALLYEDKINDHFRYGQPLNLYYNTTERIPGDIDRSAHEGDSGLYMGAYLAAQSYRFGLAKKELASATPGSEVHTFWSEQLDAAKQRVDTMVAKYHVNINIARYWQTTLDPKINADRDPLERGFIDYGGGLFPGEAGLLFRVCHPTDAPEEFNLGLHFGSYPTVVTLPWEDGKTYHCLGGTSRDQYAGATHGLTTALDIVGPHDPALRKMAANDLMAMTDYAVKYVFNQPRPHGEVVIPELGGNDLTGPISPLFLYTPYARMNLIQVARNAAIKVNDKRKLKYATLWAEELATQLPQLQASMLIDATSPHDAPYKFHLNHLTGDNIIRHEPNQTVRDRIRQSFAVMDASTGDDGNALFEAMTYSLTGDPQRIANAVQHHREWLDYKANADANGNIIDFRPQCGTLITCVPTDQVDMVQKLPSGQELVVPFTPGTSEVLRSTTPRPVALRRPADFLWQKDPTIIVGCGGGVFPGCDPTDSGRWAGGSTDFLQTYWMIRYYTEVAPPARAPFGKWAGPSFI